MRIAYTERALADLRAISAYLKPRSPGGAKNVRNAIGSTISHLAAFPQLGRLQSAPGVYKINVRKYPYLIYYTFDRITGTITIVTIRHGFQQREFDDA